MQLAQWPHEKKHEKKHSRSKTYATHHKNSATIEVIANVEKRMALWKAITESPPVAVLLGAVAVTVVGLIRVVVTGALRTIFVANPTKNEVEPSLAFVAPNCLKRVCMTYFNTIAAEAWKDIRINISHKRRSDFANVQGPASDRTLTSPIGQLHDGVTFSYREWCTIEH